MADADDGALARFAVDDAVVCVVLARAPDFNSWEAYVCTNEAAPLENSCEDDVDFDADSLDASSAVVAEWMCFEFRGARAALGRLCARCGAPATLSFEGGLDVTWFSRATAERLALARASAFVEARCHSREATRLVRSLFAHPPRDAARVDATKRAVRAIVDRGVDAVRDAMLLTAMGDRDMLTCAAEFYASVGGCDDIAVAFSAYARDVTPPQQHHHEAPPIDARTRDAAHALFGSSSALRWVGARFGGARTVCLRVSRAAFEAGCARHSDSESDSAVCVGPFARVRLDDDDTATHGVVLTDRAMFDVDLGGATNTNTNVNAGAVEFDVVVALARSSLELDARSFCASPAHARVLRSLLSQIGLVLDGSADEAEKGDCPTAVFDAFTDNAFDRSARHAAKLVVASSCANALVVARDERDVATLLGDDDDERARALAFLLARAATRNVRFVVR